MLKKLVLREWSRIESEFVDLADEAAVELLLVELTNQELHSAGELCVVWPLLTLDDTAVDLNDDG